MNEYYKYNFDEKTGILYKLYFGKITLDDIFKSWEKSIKQKIFDLPIKGFILDYRQANFNIDLKEYYKIAEFYKNHLDLFGGFKIAIVTESVKDNVIPSLVKGKDDGYSSKPFYTMEGAEKWVLSK